jgi:hypothetical protein
LKKLHFAAGLSLPLAAVTQKIAAVGRSGSGKSYAASKLVELMIEAGLQVVVVDPVGIHWGLRLAANGESRGLDIPVLGGEHGEIALEPTSGKVIADLVAEQRASLILDVSMMTQGEQRRFVGEFAHELLHAKKRHRSPLMIVWEESQEFAPQHVPPKNVDAAKMAGAMQRLIKIGRNFGIGTFLITQRPQAVDKDVLNQTEVLLVFQMTGAHERKAVLQWIVDKGLDQKLVDSLAGLAEGDGYLWSPAWLRLFTKFRALPKKTLDVSATPEVGADEVASRALPEIDLDAVRKAMAATIERAKGEDPKMLKLRISQLEREVRELKMNPPEAKVERVEVPVPVLTEPMVRQVGLIADRVETGIRDQIKALGELAAQIKNVPHEAAKAWQAPPVATIQGRTSTQRADSGAMIAAPAGSRVTKSPASRPAGGNGKAHPAGEVTDTQQRILDTIAMLEVRGVSPDRQAVARWMGIHPNGGRYLTDIARLREAGHLEQQGMALTGVGRVQAAAIATGQDEALKAAELKKPGCRAVLAAVIDTKGPLTRQELAEKLGIHPNGGRFLQNLARLREMGLIPEKGAIHATEAVFQ